MKLFKEENYKANQEAIAKTPINNIKGLVEGRDYIDFGEAIIGWLGSCHFYQPLTYLGSKTLASNAVPPARRESANWSISSPQSNKGWRDYIRKNIRFLFLFTKYTKYLLTIDSKNQKNFYSFKGLDIRRPDWGNNPYILKCIENLKEPSKPTLEELLAQYKGILVKNPDGTIDMIKKVRGVDAIDVKDFIKDGHFICQFNKWADHLDVMKCGLLSLEGSPRIIEGDFNCMDNHLTSLKGGPKVVKGYYDCRDNNLTSLEGAPEIVGDRFDCGHNNLTSLKKAPQKVGSFYCEYNNLTSLEGCPKKVEILDCTGNQLTSLKGGPEEVTENYECSHNKLISLIGAPKKIGSSFYCIGNQLTSFEGGPEYIEGLIMCYGNPKLGTIASTKGIPSYIGNYMLCSLRFKRVLEKIGVPFKIEAYSH